MRQLVHSYPDPRQFIETARVVSHRDRAALVRLWLTEGIPYAFRECPALYEAVRAWLAWRLEVHAKHVTIIGSGRIGFSLSPSPKLGNSFGPKSDLDFSIVSEHLFAKVADAFHSWAGDYSSERVHPRDDRERLLWDSNLTIVRRGLPLGFVDPGKVPTWERYPVSRQVAQTFWALNRKLERTKVGPLSSRATVRVFRDWPSLVDRVSSNLGLALKTVGPGGPAAAA